MINIKTARVENEVPSEITVHLGANPSKGGKPPRDRNIIEIILISFNFILLWLRWKIWNLLKTNIKAIEIIIYVIKYNTQIVFENNIAKVIHPMWLMEEKARSLRRKNSFKPPTAPRVADINLTIIISLGLWLTSLLIRKKGPTFCTVNSTMFIVQESLSATTGNQKCKGAAPNFKLRARMITAGVI